MRVICSEVMKIVHCLNFTGETITQRLNNLSGQDQKDTKDRLERLMHVVKGKLTSVEGSWLDLHRNIVDAKVRILPWNIMLMYL